ncbi:MAG: S-methyl-5-thioribose-1-phosphate isomerase [Euryarchaeota archaeon]|nr:S-methyl-5-thioribose-1-phosphate isomerase [Euryarchaeota archaeon]
MKVGEREFRAVWWEGDGEGRVVMIDQRRLPHELVTVAARTVEEVAFLIMDMAVRGAPTIGATAAYGMVLGRDDPKRAANILGKARPTARDLFTAIEWMVKEPSRERAEAYVEGIVARCRMIGEHGAELLGRIAADRGRANVLTHCHAGALAAVDHGTALAPIHAYARGMGADGVRPLVWVDETRPRLQGAITAWELSAAGIDHKVVVDNAAGHLLSHGEADVVIVGADRIAANGDVANKVGTYGKAVLAKEHGVPFYVAAPSTTIDLSLPDGSHIEIEERGESEVLELRGRQLFGAGTHAFNPAFDVTPARFVTGYITESGVLQAEQLEPTFRPRDKLENDRTTGDT